MAEVTDNAAQQRFELRHGQETAFVTYRRDAGRVVLIHTEVPAALEGRGIGSALVRGVLDRLQAEGLGVVPACSFVAGFIDRHPDYRSMVAAD